MNKEQLQEALGRASPAERQELLVLVQELERREKREACQKDFLEFVRYIWPDFIYGDHHRKVADLFNKVASGDVRRLIISMPPRHTKSEFASYLLPAWFLGRFPKKQVMQTSNTAELAEGFGRKVRNLLGTPEYQDIYPDVSLRADSQAAGRWNTNHDGIYYATGVGAALAGRGADLAIIDDPHTEAEALSAMMNPGIYDKVYSWFTSGPRQRLQPNGAIVIVQTRWSNRDLVGQILENSENNPGSDQWTYVELPAILPSGRPLWEAFWPIEQLLAVKAEIPAAKWNAQYQQQPTSDESAIIKRAWWQPWTKKDPPRNVEYTIMAMDTAFEAKQSADYSAAVLFGVWENDEDGLSHLILLNAWRDKVEFPALKAKTLDLYKDWEPDSVIIEKRASGAPLIYELRAMGIPVQEFTPSKGNDKITRLNAIADIFASGRVWAPERRWADTVIDEIASFPSAKNDDYVDCCSLALARFRRGGFISTKLDKVDEEDWSLRARRANYY